jgi:hypothetical protein
VAAVGFVAVFLVTALLTSALMRRAQVWRLVALPDARRRHGGAVRVSCSAAASGCAIGERRC